jgi:ATPase subunit of ABC transporter with duplicated ATPase domains
MAHEFIYTCYKLARFYPPDRTILENISLSFYPGAKIGVIGSNGSGKSSLLRIMAGLDDGYTGEARLTPGFTVGLLEQEPQLDPTKDVLGNVMDGVAPIRDMLTRYDEVMAMWADPDADYDKVGAMQAELEDKIAALTAAVEANTAALTAANAPAAMVAAPASPTIADLNPRWNRSAPVPARLRPSSKRAVFSPRSMPKLPTVAI